MHRLSPPLLLPSQTRRLPTSSPGLVPPRVPDPLNVKFALLILENGIEFPALPQTTAVTTTFEPLPPAVTCDGNVSVYCRADIGCCRSVALVPTETSPGLTPSCDPCECLRPHKKLLTNRPKRQNTLIVPCACVHDGTHRVDLPGEPVST